MKQYHASTIKNIAIAGHGGSGKTTLVEALLHATGGSERLGRVEDGTTVSDWDPEEIKRGISVSMSVCPMVFRGCKINLLDTPGQFDFAAGLYEGVRAAESVLLTVSGKSGVTVGAQKAYRLAKKQNKATAVFVGKLDRESADFYKVLEQLKTLFGPTICPVVVPYSENQKVQCYISLIEMKAYKYTDGKAQEVPMPEIDHRLQGLITAISEAVAETDEELFEKYFSGEEFTNAELVMGIHKGVKSGDITPVYCGSAITGEGLDLLLDGLDMLLPTAKESAMEAAKNPEGEEVAVLCDEDRPLTALVFKTVADPFVGKLSFIKVIGGKLQPGSTPKNMTTGQNEKMGKIVLISGKQQEDMPQIVAGDIGAVAKLSANTGDTLCQGVEVTLAGVDYPKATFQRGVVPAAKGEESKVSQAIRRLAEEDPTIVYGHNHETHQQLISGLGEQHLDVAMSKIKSKFGVSFTLADPIVAYRETIRKKVKVQGKYKKQSGGHGQFGDVWVEFEPCDSEELIFEERVVGGAVPKNFFPAVEKGLREAAKTGVLAGYPTVGIKAVLVDGSYHPVDSSEMSFKTAASLAYKEGIPQAGPVLLEPIGSLAVTVPDSCTGDMMGELNKRRGRVLGMSPADEGETVIEAEIPLSETADFSTLVRQMTQGAGEFTLELARYEQLPSQLEAAVIAAAKERNG